MSSPVIPPIPTLWTLQSRVVWDQLAVGEVVRAPEELCWPRTDPHPTIERAYDWMSARLDYQDPRPANGPRWPLWTYWTTEPGQGPQRPDLRRYRPHGPGVLIGLRVPRRRVLLTDVDRWHVVLNDWDPGSSERHRLEQVKRNGWRACLAVHPHRVVQGVLWEIRPSDVVEHRFYQGRPTRPSGSDAEAQVGISRGLQRTVYGRRSTDRGIGARSGPRGLHRCHSR